MKEETISDEKLIHEFTCPFMSFMLVLSTIIKYLYS